MTRTIVEVLLVLAAWFGAGMVVALTWALFATAMKAGRDEQ